MKLSLGWTNSLQDPSLLRVATFITCIGPDALEIHTGLPFQSDEDRQNIDKVHELWQNYCIEKTSTQQSFTRV